MIDRFAFAKIIVADLARLEGFYTGSLGMRCVTRIAVDTPGWELDEVIMEVGSAGGAMLNLVRYRTKPCPPPGEAVIGLDVPDINKMIESVIDGGGTLVQPVVDIAEHQLRVAYVADPEGHLIEFLERY